MYHTLFVPLDGSPIAERALPYALALAKNPETRLIVARAVPPSPMPFGERTVDRTKAMGDAGAYLSELFPFPSGRPRIETVALFDDPSRMIVEEAGRREVDLIVMSTHRRAGRGAWHYDSVADHVFRQTDVPVLVIPADTARAWTDGRPPRILVPLDGSELAEEVLPAVVEFAATLGGEIALLRVASPVAYRRVGEFEDEVAIPLGDADEAQARNYLDQVAEGIHGVGTVTVHVVGSDRPLEAILEATEELEADAVALSTHGWTGLGQLLMGSVAAGLVAKAKTPLLFVRPVRMRKSRSTSTAATLRHPNRGADPPDLGGRAASDDDSSRGRVHTPFVRIGYDQKRA